MTDVAQFSKVGYTAVWTAYLRSFTDIPFAKELYNALRKIEYGNESIDLQKPTMAPQYEARYKILTKLLLDSKIDQVLELAAGFTGRGLSLSNDFPLDYVELEISPIVREKKKLLNLLCLSNSACTLKLVPGNALSPVDLEKAISDFSNKRPVAILNEGLMRYLTFPEKTVLAKNIHAILSCYGGVWITPDISLATLLITEDEAVTGHTDKLISITGKNVHGNLFASVRHAVRFFKELGFSVERHSLLEVSDELTSPNLLGISAAEVQKMNGSAAVFVMRIA